MSYIQQNNQETEASCSNNYLNLPEDYLTYPPINDDILLNITNSLQKNPRFYIQVLALMKQMNLSITSEAIDNQLSVQKDPDSDESEIETDVDFKKETVARKQTILQSHANRELRKNTLFHKYSQRIPPKSCSKPKEIDFDPPKFVNNKRKILILCTKVASNLNELGNDLVEKPIITITNEDITSNRLKDDELSSHPLFQNYQPGIPSNKLYVKNLANCVTSIDLKSIFFRYIHASEEEIDIRLFKMGRLKDQCYVTFKLFSNQLKRREAERLIEKARLETNGFVLKKKPMFVVYGINGTYGS